MRIFLTIFSYAKFSTPLLGKKVGKGMQKFSYHSSEERSGVISMPYTHGTTVYAQTSCRDMGNHSRFLMKNPDLPEVSRLPVIKNSLIHMMQ